MDWNEVVTVLVAELGEPLRFDEALPVSGGDVNAAFDLRCGSTKFFAKLNSPDKLAMFEQESAQLKRLKGACSLRVPRPYVTGKVGSHAYLVMEFVELGPVGETSAAGLGEGLAVLHQTTADQYGWSSAGYLGLTRQLNERSTSWCEFWRSQRLGFQQRLALRNGLPAHIAVRLELLTDSLQSLLGDYHPPAALLHGDLWHANCGADEEGTPVIFDPASYFGDPEADLAMTELFGGFPESFYQAYWNIHPRAVEYEVRSQLYQLYHVLNHFNLFGGLYGNRAGTMVDLLLAEIGH